MLTSVRTAAKHHSLFLGVTLGVLSFASCDQCDVKVEHVNRTGAVEETVAQLAICGMLCEIACVSKVKKELYDLPGVTRADIQFKEQNKVDTALVVFDPSVIQAETLIATVQAIGDGLYDVKAAQVVHYAPEASR